MSATCLRAYISDNQDGPFIELTECVYVPFVEENKHEFLAHDNEKFRKAWNNLLRGEEIATAFLLFRVNFMVSALEKKMVATIGELYYSEIDGLLHAPVERIWTVG